MWTRLRLGLRALLRRPGFEQDLTEELRLHLDLRADDLMQSGLPADEARRRARIELGCVDGVKDDCREARGLRAIDELRRNLRQASRRLRQAPGFTFAALATLGLCLAANLAIFATVDGVLLRPLPFPDAERLVRIFNSYPQAGVLDDGCSLPNYYERRGRLPALETLAAYWSDTAVVGEDGATEREDVLRVSPEFFATLGRGPILGRAFTEAETTYATDRVVILSDVFWRQRLAADPDVIGRTLRVDGLEMTVVGLLPPDFRFLSSTARLFFPFSSGPGERVAANRHSGGGSRQMIARLAPSASIAEAQAQVDAHNAAVGADDPRTPLMAVAGFHSRVVPLHADHVASVRPTLLLLQVGALFLLSIGCVNVANLFLVRATSRVKELALRHALGAGRRHVVADALTETTLLTLAGAAVGLALGGAALRLLPVLAASQLPLGARVALDARIALAALAAALAMGVAMAIPIAWYSVRGPGTLALGSESRTSTTHRSAQRLRHAFLVAQVALSFVLLSGAGLLTVSLHRVMSTAPGFRPDGVVSALAVMTVKDYPSRTARIGFADRLLEELQRQPGVRSAGVATHVPLDGWSGKSAARVEGHSLPPGSPPQGHYSYGVGGDYFATLGFVLHEGRWLDAGDMRGRARVCVVDDDFARRYWPAGGALGRRLFWGSEIGADSDAFTVVGVVGAAKQAALSDSQQQGAVYYPYGYGPISNDLFVVARAEAADASLGGTLQRVVRAVGPGVALSDVRLMENRVSSSLAARRTPALLAGLFACVAVLLTAIGTYGLLSYAVAQRRREIGVRLALGARPSQISWQFVSLALRLLAVGMVLGLLGSWWAGHAMQAVLVRVPGFHRETLVLTAALLGAIALVACLAPAYRATRISPVRALADD
jgi:predicted permease